MINLNLNGRSGSALQILCLGCHSDDIEIGCGGAMLQLAEKISGVHVSLGGIQCDRGSGGRGTTFRGAVRRVHHPAGSDLEKLSGWLHAIRRRGGESGFRRSEDDGFPDLIFTTSRKDAHQDHRLIAELTWNTFRDHLILEYEIPKYDGDLGQPNVFVPLQPEVYERKISHLMDAFQSQHVKRWFDRNTFLSLMRLRGMECNAPSGYAEAFYCHKLVLEAYMGGTHRRKKVCDGTGACPDYRCIRLGEITAFRANLLIAVVFE